MLSFPADLPGIVSGETIGFLDPHEKHFELGEPGRRYDINLSLFSGEHNDQFWPFHGIFGCDISNANSYDHTLFRFPLRTTPSKLSEKEYTKQMVEGLFESLREEGPVILLFLKSVQSISVHERKEDGEIKCVFKVEVAEDTREEIRRKRDELLSKAKEPGVTESRYVFVVQVTSDSETKNFRWLVLNQIGSTEKRVTELAEELHLLPWVGCAVPINDANNEYAGRVFCFLPLPPDVDCETGLPVHIHGYFGVMDNRRGLVWPGNECQNNETAEWNELLLKTVGSALYRNTLEALVTDQPRTGLSKEQRSRLVYSALPDLDKVRGHWNCILDPLFEELVDQKLFYSVSASDSSWITLKEGILDRPLKSGAKPETRNAILRTLRDNMQVIITHLPNHVDKIVDNYFGRVRDINPTLVRAVLKSCPNVMASPEDKILLLDYVLNDNPTTDLFGVPLLPLADKNFITFHPHNHASNPSTSVFVPDGNCTALLLPNMSSRFLDESLSAETAKKLHNIAATEINKENSTQLVLLTKDLVIQNLPASFPSTWSTGRCHKVKWTPDKNKHPPEKWLEDIWHWIHASYPDSLALFEGVPLIPLPPLPRTVDRSLGVLSQHHRFIFNSDSSGNVLPSQISSLLTACGCTVISDLPPYSYHPDINSYIASPTPAGASAVLSRLSLGTVQEHMKQMSNPDNRTVFREFFCHLPGNVPIAQKHFLLQLPLFDTLSGSSTPAQVNGQALKGASSDFYLPSDFKLDRSDQIISSADSNACQLLTLLGVEILKPADVFVRYLFPDIQARSVYDKKKTTRIMLWILQQMFILKNQHKSFHEKMKELPFVPTNDGEMKKASELYDPNDALVFELFLEETNKFPACDFTETTVISAMKELGLRTRRMLTAVELYGVAVSVDSSPISQSSVRKVDALLKILHDNPDYLNQRVDEGASLKDKLLQLKWLPCAEEPPENVRFPEFMPWYSGNSALFTPAELRSKSQALLIGSSMPILGVEMNEKLQEEFGINSDPPVDQVVRQLQTAIKNWQQQRREKFSFKFQEMLLAIYLQLSRVSHETITTALKRVLLQKWVWQGAGFCSPENVALEKDFPLDLRPQLFLLPEDLKDRTLLVQFFLKHGVRERFSEGDILGVLDEIRDKHKNLSPNVSVSSEVESDLRLCCSVLEWVVRDGETLSASLREKVLVPVQSARNVLDLEPCKKCTYCDRDWLRRGGSELDIPDEYRLIHHSVPPRTAMLLGVPALSTCLLSAETLGFEQTGPHEPITTRLNNILKEYKEGVGVFKELIQNADDAGASEVRFLVDWRHGPEKKLLTPDMARCQGPALWAYNNAVFTDKDFENINKLAGATKVEDLAKIGRFGLGFNAVYHLTDVPSFVSRNHVVIFDPNVNHLESHIHDKSRPGIRINLASNPRPLSTFEDQFQPYHNVFGCKTQGLKGGTFNYSGTLFRFPFRTLPEAKESDICKSVYDQSKVKEIVGTLKENASLLLLYTQHVNVIELYEAGKKDDPRNMRLVLSSTKDEQKSLRTTSISNNVPFIEECSDWWEKKTASSNIVVADPSRSELMTIKIKEMASDLTGTKKKSEKSDTWLLSSCVGSDSSVHLASEKGREHGLMPCAGAAAKLDVRVQRKTSTVSTKFIPKSVTGEAFCFLPLSIPTGFPVHVNGYFAIRSNRDGIWEKNTSDQGQPIEVQWNECLLEDASSEAYVQLLKDMKRLSEDNRLQRYSFHELWPNYDKLRSSTWGTLVKSVYTKVVKEDLPLLKSNGNWMSMESGYILHEDLHGAPGIIEALQLLEENVFQFPSNVLESLKKSGQQEAVERRTLTVESFFKNFFFPNLLKIPQRLRDPLVCYGLDRILSGRKTLESFYQEYACITCSTDEQHLAKPCELINPEGPVANLFSAEDHRFPVGDKFLTRERLFVLEKLGMVKDLLSWMEICGRAQSVEKLADVSYERGLERVRNLMKYLKENIQRIEAKTKAEKDVLNTLQSTRFMPFMSQPPQRYTLPWEGSRHAANQFFTPKDLFLPNDVDLVGSCCLVVDDSDGNGSGKLGERVKTLMGFDKRRPKNDLVLQQLDIAINGKAEKSLTDSVCKKVYKHLNHFVKEPTNSTAVEKLIDELGRKSWLYIQERFVTSAKVAFDWKGNGAPYLYSLPDEYRRKYDCLLHAACIKQEFEAKDFINALKTLSDLKKGAVLDKDELKLTLTFVNELRNVENDVVKAHVGKIPLPDKHGVLCRSEELTINTTFWLKDRGDARYVHKDISQQLALDLGAKLLRNRRRKKYSNTLGVSFGQHEKLTDRLKNILKSYPCDSGILKELVQNADDAKATQIHFIYDTRVLPHERVFQEEAEEIQGPALCVYNDRPFSDDDLEGIQKLGIGSKINDPEKTGQYGIGFNAVYHLTDCPSFLSDDETLCILDPHCRYAPEATPESPGEQFRPIDDEFKEDFSDSLRGYLGDHFRLKGGTMFRLPLRTAQMCRESQISNDDVDDSKMRKLLTIFKSEAKKMLLFLNHVKEIALSEIDSEGNFKEEYWVRSDVNEEHEKKRLEITSLIKEYKDRATHEVPWKGTTYPMTLLDSMSVSEEWLIHQCCGAKQHEEDDPIPDGRRLGLFPRGGIAALVSSSRPPFTPTSQREYVAYCFLPLPVNTFLPVNVNGHFALNPSRRDLWKDADPGMPNVLSKWNKFIKSHVLAPAYAALITEARNYIPHSERDSNDQYYFQNREDAKKGLKWYYDLFPDPNNDPAWKILVIEFYRSLGREEMPILPVVVLDEANESTATVVHGMGRNTNECTIVSQEMKRMTSNLAPPSSRMETRSRRTNTAGQGEQSRLRGTATASSRMVATASQVSVTSQRRREQAKYAVNESRSFRSPTLDFARSSHVMEYKTRRSSAVSLKRYGTSNEPLTRIRMWLPASETFFAGEMNPKLFPVLLRVHMPLLVYSPVRIHHAFNEAEIHSNLLNSKSVIDFLRTSQCDNSKCKIGKLPADLKETAIRSRSDLRQLIAYCRKEKQFFAQLEGLPLLLTADGLLRSFDSSSPVYRSVFSDLFPARAHRFVHPEFVKELTDVSEKVDEDQPLPQAMLDLTVSSLASFMADVFPKHCKGLSKHVPWKFPEEGVLSEKWFKRLWEFLENDAKPEPNEERVSLNTLGDWPIIPTTCGNLVTINNGKSVLDMTESRTENVFGQKVREILENLGCPSLRKDITQPQFTGKSSILDTYVAHPHSAPDVLRVLDYMRTIEILDVTKLADHEILKLLSFFQEDPENIHYVNILKALPFYKAIDGNYYTLAAYLFCALVPRGIPDEEMIKLQENYRKRYLFLHPDAFPGLNKLYRMLGARMEHSYHEFYKEYILPHFDIFSKKCQINFLTHIKDTVLPRLLLKHDFVSYLRSTPCIPDEAGKLHVASDFYDPRNKVFKIMLDSNYNQFPSDPFNDPGWLRFLIQLGLKDEVEKEQFLKFCRQVESEATKFQGADETNRKRSEVLVQYLFNNPHFHDQRFLIRLSDIQFIFPEKVDDFLSSLHNQHGYKEPEKKLEYIRFRNSVPWDYRKLVWTSAQLLPQWVYTLCGYIPANTASHLGVKNTPSIESVISHLKTIAYVLLDLSKKGALPQSPKLKDVLVSIYGFFESKEVAGSSGHTCQTIADRLNVVPCILLDNENTLVTGGQLSFAVPSNKSLQPFLYAVPQEYFVYPHFLKRLGATVEVTPLQMANVLKAIKDRSQDKKMKHNLEQIALHAMFLLFQSIVTDSANKESKTSELNELYLPSEAKLLIKSNELVCKVPPRLLKAVSKLNYHVLLPIEECGLARAQESKYLEALPEHVRPRPLETLVREELDPSCRNDTYLYCQGNCTFIEKYILVLRSTQFRQGIIRLIKHQKKSNELTDEEKEKAARFSSTKVTIKCMKTIKTRLVLVRTRTPLEGSSCERTCYVVKETGSWWLYIQHEFGGKKTQGILSKSVNEIMGNCVNDMCIAELTDMLSCDTPSQIAGVLNDHDVSRDFHEEDEELGRVIPSVYHYLIQQNPLCTFDEGSNVAYGVDMKEDEHLRKGWEEEEEDTMKYILAKIISCVSRSAQGGLTYNFEAMYMIDLGGKSETKRVSVLDLYQYQDDVEEKMMTDVDVLSDDTVGEPIHFDREKRKIREVLCVARGLSLKMRRKVIRRLYLHWLGRKNSGNAEVATEILEFLLSEVKNMEDETDSPGWFRSYRFFRCWEIRAEREMAIFRNFRGSFSGSMRSFPETPDYASPEPEEAARWVEQAQTDLEEAKFNHSTSHPFHALVCFLSEQVVEKCLKAALYAKCGLRREQLHTHDVSRLSSDVSRLNEAPKEELRRAVTVADYYLPTRYPDKQPFAKVPAQEFSKEQAKEALEIADELLKSIKTFVNGKD